MPWITLLENRMNGTVVNLYNVLMVNRHHFGEVIQYKGLDRGGMKKNQFKDSAYRFRWIRC